MRALPAAALLAALVLAGCSADDPPASDPTGQAPEPLPPGVVLHRTDGRLADRAEAGGIPVFEQRYVGTRGAGEPTIAVDRDGVAIYPSIEFDAIPENPVAGSPLAKTIVFRSTDNGTTWQDANPNVAGVPVAPTSLDPYVYADPVTGRLFTIDLNLAAGGFLSWSDDGAQTWTSNPGCCGIPVDDHQTLFSGPATVLPTSPLYPGRVVYFCVNQVAEAMCTHSLDGGVTFSAGTPAYRGLEAPSEGSDGGVCGGLHGHGHASEATGTVFLPKGHCGQAVVARSEDNGLTWSTVVVDGTVGINGHEAIVSTDQAGNVYYFFLDGQTMPRLSVSRDDGLTWSRPMNVSVPGLTAAKFPSVVAGAEGHVAFLYIGSMVPGGFDAEDADMANATWDAYVGTSFDALAEDPVFATVLANPVGDPLKRGACAGRCQGMFDFLDIDVHPLTGQVWVALVDLCNDACATPQGTSEDPIVSRGAVGVQVGGPFLGTRLPA